MTDKLYSRIGSTAKFATPREAEVMLRILAANDERFIAIQGDKKKFNRILERIKWREENKKRGIK